jgi:hypothetical protein
MQISNCKLDNVKILIPNPQSLIPFVATACRSRFMYDQSAQDPPAKDTPDPVRPPPLQFGISSLLWLMLAVGVIFGALRWMRVPSMSSMIILAVLAAAGLAVVFLAAAISKADDE